MRWIAGMLAAGALFAEQATRTDGKLKALLANHPTPEAETAIRLELLRECETRADWIPAATQLEHLRRLVPNDPEYAYQLGAVYQRISRTSFQRMRALAPQSARVQQVFGEQYSVTGETGKAIRAYQAAVAADPKMEGNHAALAMIYLQMGKVAEARAEIDRELVIAPESATAKQVAQLMQSAP
jgi:tetratricopeptide (TPR) repeat protein